MHGLSVLNQPGQYSKQWFLFALARLTSECFVNTRSCTLVSNKQKLLLAGFISCDHHESSNSSVLDSLKGVAEKTKEEIAVRLSNLTEAVEHKWEIVHEIMEGGLENESTTVGKHTFFSVLKVQTSVGSSVKLGFLITYFRTEICMAYLY